MNKSREKTKRKDKKNQPNFFSGGGRFSSLHFILKDIFLLVKRKRRRRGKKELEMSQSSSSWVRRITAGAGAVVQDCLCILYSNNNGEGGKNKRQQQNDDGIWALFVVLVCSHVLCLAFFLQATADSRCLFLLTYSSSFGLRRRDNFLSLSLFFLGCLHETRKQGELNEMMRLLHAAATTVAYVSSP